MSLSESALPDPVSVVRGDAEPEELAALVAVLVSRSQARPTERPPSAHPGWTDRAALARSPLTPGPGAWRRGLR